MASFQNLTISNAGYVTLPTGGSGSRPGGNGIDIFTKVGTNYWTCPAGVTSVEYLVVGGGGGGGSGVQSANNGGGGGAGGLLSGTLTVTPGTTYTITVGAGGEPNTNGGNSSVSGSGITTITAIGGGAGGGRVAAPNGVPGQSGGSGGGGGPAVVTTGGTGTAGQGNNGAAGNAASPYHGGGGGGKGGAGVTVGGTGGVGVQSSITGTAVWYAAGGGGGADTNAGIGGSGIGGNGGLPSSSLPTAGLDGFGAGGGGGSSQPPSITGARGGSGTVILKYTNPVISPVTGMIRNNNVAGRLESYNGSSWTKATNLIDVQIYLWGAGGGGGTPGGWSYGAAGGGGGFCYGKLINIPSNSLLALVIGQGGKVNSTTNAYGGGGKASTNGTDNRYGSGGGGYTGLFFVTTYDWVGPVVQQADAIMIAGGGGGGGSSRAGTGNQGGAGGGTRGQDGVSAYDNKPSYRGIGGNQNSAGADATSTSANTTGGQGALFGGAPRTNCYGGAGGGGYWGGSAGGYSESNTMGGGGGGSGFINPAYVAEGINMQGELQVPAGVTSQYYTGSYGYGGNPSTAGNNGYAVIIRNGVAKTYTYSGVNQLLYLTV